ncbi:LANO_0F08768g1_1 [Lachancea nothofagi CBS 11611]|uniref:LANO_0F08768g1_1 n=1 Tax=Lachancea nothofagi CBS 11611 TaxID=1266666 RepID=A0A1G4K9N7_9SACH|nr:LANO_0F08768g1_1 [Lachancea nothofagi CBS 11611]
MSDLIEPDFDASERLTNPFSDPGVLDAGLIPRAGRGTLDESVAQTLKRDLLQINSRLKQVVYPRFSRSTSRDQPTRDPESMIQPRGMGSSAQDHCADLWAPLLFTIAYSVALSRRSEQFSNLFVLSWAALGAIAVHLTLGKTDDGRNTPFLAAVSTCGYCLFPHVINAISSSLLFPLFTALILAGQWRYRVLAVLRIVVFAACSFWSCSSAFNAMGAKGPLDKYPLILVLLTLNWSCVVS